MPRKKSATNAKKIVSTKPRLGAAVALISSPNAAEQALPRRKRPSGLSERAGSRHRSTASPPPFLLVGVGASAGGFEAFGQFLSHLSPAPGLALVLVQHLDPAHESNLSELLARVSPMPVREVTQGTKVEPNQVYVIPRNVEGRYVYELGNGQWDIPKFRTLQEEVMPNSHRVNDFVFEVDLPALGKRLQRVNATKFSGEGSGLSLILLSLEHATGPR